MQERAIELAGDGSRLEVLFTEAEIRARLAALAREIADLSLGNLIVVAVLKGSFVFAADLIRALHAVHVTPEVDFITLSSYRRSMVSTGTVDILRDIELDVGDRHVLLVDDVLDSGRTLAYAKDLLSARGARSIRTCVLLEKQIPRAIQLEADLKAFTCPDMFVVGYGMDLAHRFRELPFVGRLVTQ